MEKFDFSDLDTKSMRLASLIAETGSVSEAAFALDLSQSTASYRLDGLRKALGDPMFVRNAGGMEPTEMGARAITVFARILGELRDLASEQPFDPALAERDFVVAAAAFEIETIVARLQRHLINYAPKCRLIVRPVNSHNLSEFLREGCDIALISEPPAAGGIKQVLVLRDELVTYFDPAVRDAPASLEAFCEAEHAVASLGGTARSGVDKELQKLGRRRKVRLETSNLESLAPLMKGTPLVTTIPSRLGAGLMRDFESVTCPLPFPVIPFHAVWHSRKDNDAAHRWLRRTLVSLSGKDSA